jgi:NADPH-dependent 2,4-dienoyl-CoA reductase/sulfur reductase-like enzyme
MTNPVVIVGASMGGLRTAESLRRFGYSGEIIVIGDENYAPYNRPPLSKEVLAADEVTHAAVAFPQRPATEDVVWKLGKKVISADLEGCEVTLDDGEKFQYSALVVATGLRPKRQTYANDIQKGRHVIRSLDDALALRAELAPGKKVVVLGAGFIGCETAATAKKLGCDVTIVSPGDLPIKRPLGEQLAAEIMRRHEQQGFKFLMENTVEDLVGSDRVIAVKLGDNKQLDCDVFIEAIGSIANVEWLDGNDVVNTDGLLTDSTLRVMKESQGVWENVFAVGDVAKFPNQIFDEHARRVEHWNIPTECAKYVGQIIAAMQGTEGSIDDLLANPFKPVPSFWSDQFDTHILAFGLPALADSADLVQGEISGDCVFEYHRQGQLVGVAGIGLRSVVQGYRKEFER